MLTSLKRGPGRCERFSCDLVSASSSASVNRERLEVLEIFISEVRDVVFGLVAREEAIRDCTGREDAIGAGLGAGAL